VIVRDTEPLAESVCAPGNVRNAQLVVAITGDAGLFDVVAPRRT
jgi:hypothetical protein